MNSAPPLKPARDAKGMLAVAIEQARIGLAEGGIPVGGAIFRTDGTLVGAGRNRLVQNGDPSMHGETDAFRAAGRQPRYRDLILVTTLAPLLVLHRIDLSIRIQASHRRR